MLENIEQLHTATRRYCIENYDFWLNKYFELNETLQSDNDYTDEAYSIFSRYNALNAILIEVERFQPNDFSSFKEAKEFFCLISKEANSIFTKPPNNKIIKSPKKLKMKNVKNFVNLSTN